MHIQLQQLATTNVIYINIHQICNENATKAVKFDLRVFELLFDIFYDSSAVEASENAADELWVNGMCANHLASDLGQRSNT